jgi:peptide/nickel transport system permease protein
MDFRSGEYYQAFRKSRKLSIGVTLVVILLIVAICAPILAPYDPNEIDVKHRLSGISKEHPLGTDQLGRDSLSRIIYGARTSILISVLGTLLAFGIGLSLGIIGGYARGKIEHVILLYFDVIRSFPAIILILVMISVIGPSIKNIIIIFAFSYSPLIGRTVRAMTLSISEEPFIESAVTLGSNAKTILLNHIFPNLIGPILIVMGMYIPIMIMSEAGLSFLSLGVPPPTASWGDTLRYGFENIKHTYLLIMPPSAAIFIAMLSFNLFAEGLRDILNPEKRGELIIS